jgi:tetratricopeptide (TPR) repeat protein
MKIGSVEMETDPAEALKEFQAALQGVDALPRSDFSNVRLRAFMLRKQANALERMGACAQAVPRFEEALEITQRIAAQDARDSRALFDFVTVLDDEAVSYEDAADPVLGATAGERRVNLTVAEKKLVQAAAGLERLLKQDPANDVYKSFLGFMQVRIGAIRGFLHTPGAWEELSRRGLVALKEVAEKKQASPMVLDQVANAFLIVEPASLRNPRFAVACAKREVATSAKKTPSRLLTLAQAYRASGQIEKSRAAAKEGLALLPTPQPGSMKPNIRKRLENEAQTRLRSTQDSRSGFPTGGP